MPGTGPGSWGQRPVDARFPSSFLKDWPLGNSPKWGWTGMGAAEGPTGAAGLGLGPAGCPRQGWSPASVMCPRAPRSGVTGCDAASARALGLEKNLPGPRSPNTQPIDLSRQLSRRRSCSVSFKLRESQSGTLEPKNQPPCVSPLFKKQL